jgi:hypothetical protein
MVKMMKSNTFHGTKEVPAMSVQLNRDLDNEYSRDEVVQCQQPGAGMGQQCVVKTKCPVTCGGAAKMLALNRHDKRPRVTTRGRALPHFDQSRRCEFLCS